jgi:glycosyltransferase involved in cell wall biosynthesis
VEKVQSASIQLSVIVPAYNDEHGIADVLRELESVMDQAVAEYEIIVVDDGSTDNTAEQVTGERVRLIRRKTNRGYGASLKLGLRNAKFDWIAITDADGTYPSDALPMLIEAAKSCDMVVGARTGANVNIPLIRRFPKWVLRRLASYLAEREIPDLNSGLRVFRRDIAMQFERLYPSGFSFTTTITLAFLSNDYVVDYIPINYFKRVGRSKIRPIRDTLGFLSLIVRTSMYYAPLKIFGPLSFAFLTAGLVRGVYDVIWLRNLTTADLLLLTTGSILLGIGLLADLIDKRL